MKINEILPLEHIFTEKLKMLALIPKMLYFYGKLPKRGDNRLKCVAIVGSRKNTSYGKEVAYKAAYEAAKAGAVVVSGLAYGVDSIAHRGALDAGGITVAVLGTPINEIYPKEHTSLAREIIEKDGAVISEYGENERAGSRTEAGVRFLARNRIIAGLSDVVLVAEAAARSGTLNTATHALDMGVDLMAAPGDINRLSSKGCNRLLSQGAMPYTEPDDLLNLLFPERLRKQRRSRVQDEEEEFLKIKKFAETAIEERILKQIFIGASDGDDIIKNLGISAAEFGQAITILEIKGAVKSLGANNWMILA